MSAKSSPPDRDCADCGGVGRICKDDENPHPIYACFTCAEELNAMEARVCKASGHRVEAPECCYCAPCPRCAGKGIEPGSVKLQAVEAHDA